MKNDRNYASRPGNGFVDAGVDVIVVPSGNIGRVWAVSAYASGAATLTIVLRSGVSAGGTSLYRIDTPATGAGQGTSVSFPTGLAFSNGLFIDHTAGAGTCSVCYTIDSRADV